MIICLRLYFHEGHPTHEICENFIPRKLPPIRYLISCSVIIHFGMLILVLCYTDMVDQLNQGFL